MEIAHIAATTRECPARCTLHVVCEFGIGVRHVHVEPGVPPMCVGDLQCVVVGDEPGRNLADASVSHKGPDRIQQPRSGSGRAGA